ncbi:MAG: uncharacterized protein SRB1_01329 [Desulfobacteraceae bacterium Eth-SRB1]|nr:MAG: uncharacterized protein SRB1_01329 [Desulfobacteraceae bacterium Eth-SRB1]
MKNKNKQNSRKMWQWDMSFKQNVRQLTARIKQLQGDPHYIAMGMGAGIFVCSTPTFPFQTFLAIALAFILRGSKASAVIGSWIAAPGIPLFYLGSYKVGTFLLGSSVSIGLEPKSISDLLNMGLGVAGTMLTGGIIVGLVPGIAAYFITRKVFTTIRLT